MAPRLHVRRIPLLLFFFFNDTATTEIYTLSLHDALPISMGEHCELMAKEWGIGRAEQDELALARSEEHTSELQSQSNLVCRLLLEKKKKKQRPNIHIQCVTQRETKYS